MPLPKSGARGAAESAGTPRNASGVKCELEDERDRRSTCGIDQAAVRLAHRVQHRAVGDGPAVEVDADGARRGPRDRGTTGKSAHHEPTELGVALLELEQLGLEFLAQHIERALGWLVGGREVEQLAAVRAQFERHVGMGQRDRLDRLGHARRLGCIALEELAPRGHIAEERAHLDHGAGARGRRARALERAGLDLDLGTRIAPARARDHAKAGYARDRCQRLAAEAEGVDRREILAGGDLARGVRRHRKGKLLGGYARSIVGHAHEVGAAALDLNEDAPRAGVDRILDEFLDHARWSLDDLARGDLVDELGGQHADGHQRLQPQPWAMG